MDDIVRPSLPERHVERIEHELCPKMRRHRPAHNLPTPGVEDDR
jgi:hypothetical protein